MPPIRQHEALDPSSTASSQSNGTGAKNVWFYMTGAKTSTRPQGDELQRYVEEDNQRQRSGLTYQRPQESRIRCVACLLEKDKWQTWHNRAGPVAKILRQHLDGRHAIICTDDVGDQGAEPQQSAKPTGSLGAKDQSESAPSSTNSATTEKSQSLVEAPRSSHSKAASQPTTAKFPTPVSSEGPEQPQHGEPSKPRSRAPKSVEKLRAELDRVKAECEQAKAERDKAARERRLLREEVRRLKEAERARDAELLRVSDLLSSSLLALVKK
ncbi:hypothetical protein RSAG8_05553, partial [Rhizoctonia solani AG-8 WAC10335]